MPKLSNDDLRKISSPNSATGSVRHHASGEIHIAECKCKKCLRLVIIPINFKIEDNSFSDIEEQSQRN